jgi:hypothetical protein
MNRATATLIGLASIAALLLLAVHFFAQVGFCAGAQTSLGGGSLGGCLNAVSVRSAQTPLQLIGWPAAALGLLVAARFTPRRRNR